MPTYDYECTECGDEFSVEQSMTDRPLRKCRKCGGKLRKLLPRSLNLIFKGSGFYVTDYARGRAEKGPSGESAGARKDAAGAGRDAAGAGDGPVGSRKGASGQRKCAAERRKGGSRSI